MTVSEDPFKPVLSEVPPPKSLSRRARRRANAPGPAPEDENDIDLELSFLPLHDPGNAKRLIKRFGKDMIFVDANGWFVYDGVRWVGGAIGAAEAFNKAQLICDLIVQEAKALERRIAKDASFGSQDRVDKLLQWAAQTGTVARINAMLKCASTKQRKDITEFDRDPFVVPCLNGTLVLGKKTLFRENRREDYCTKAVAIDYVPEAVCPQYDRFFEKIMPSPDMRDFVMRHLGYGMTGLTKEHKLFIWYGLGRNGKSTLMEIVRHIFGSYAATTPVEMLLRRNDQKSGSEATPEIARLPGVRLVAADEPPEHAQLNEARVKKLTGGDRTEARKLFSDLFEFKPAFKIVLLTNYTPAVYGVDEGIWRRLLLVPFLIKIPIDEADGDLGDKLKAEASGILNRIIAGAEDYFEQGLNPPEAAIEAGKEYREAQDPVGVFIDAKCEKYPDDWLDPRTGMPWETSNLDLRHAYEEWCKEEGNEPLSMKAFGSKLMGHGIKRRRSNGHTFYQIWIKGRATGLEDQAAK